MLLTCKFKNLSLRQDGVVNPDIIKRTVERITAIILAGTKLYGCLRMIAKRESSLANHLAIDVYLPGCPIKGCGHMCPLTDRQHLRLNLRDTFSLEANHAGGLIGLNLPHHLTGRPGVSLADQALPEAGQTIPLGPDRDRPRAYRLPQRIEGSEVNVLGARAVKLQRHAETGRPIHINWAANYGTMVSVA